MISTLGGNAETVAAYKSAIGKVISKIAIDKEADPEILNLTFTDGSVLSVFDAGQSCCELRYMVCDDNFKDFIGAELMEMELLDGPGVAKERVYSDDHEQQFLRVTTDKGSFTVTNHNEHNGYYGGFAIVLRYAEPAKKIK